MFLIEKPVALSYIDDIRYKNEKQTEKPQATRRPRLGKPSEASGTRGVVR
jgi:hypothetical protein